jgi:hypothetical protein
MSMSILSTLSCEKTLTAPTAPLSLASVKMSTSCDACVALASHETSANQGVVAAFGTLGKIGAAGRAPVNKGSGLQINSLVSSVVFLAYSSEKRTRAPFQSTDI